MKKPMLTTVGIGFFIIARGRRHDLGSKMYPSCAYQYASVRDTMLRN